jgi:hypothetical protein
MMARVADVVGHWLGLCRKPPMFRTAPLVLIEQAETTCPVQPDGGAGGSARINRGISTALSGTKTLIQNKQLFWFPLLIGVVTAFMLIVQYALHLLSVYPYDALDFPRWMVLTFIAELLCVFCLTILMAGLVLSLSPAEGGLLSFREGLSRTRQYLRTLADWSVIVSLLGIAIFLVILTLDFVYLPVHMMFSSVFHQFPFGFVLLPEYFHIGPIAGTFALQYGLMYTLLLFGINLGLFVLSLFVVPLLVLENKRIPEAIAGSVSLMKNVGGEMVACFVILGLVVGAFLLTALFFPWVYGVVAPDMLLFWYPGDGWIAAAVVFMLAWCALALISTTVAGIAAVKLYVYGKTGQLPGLPEEKPENTTMG